MVSSGVVLLQETVTVNLCNDKNQQIQKKYNFYITYSYTQNCLKETMLEQKLFWQIKLKCLKPSPVRGTEPLTLTSLASQGFWGCTGHHICKKCMHINTHRYTPVYTQYMSAINTNIYI